MTNIQQKGQSRVPSGEGERRAQRGFVTQYELASRLIYEAIADGTLRWVGLADPKAGIFDDLLLGFEDTVIGYQVKSTKSPQAFRLRTLFFGAENIWQSIVSSWLKLRDEYPNVRVELRYATDNFLDTTDDLNSSGLEPISSAAFQRAHERYRGVWTIADWRKSAFAPFVEELFATSALSEDEFSQLWHNLSFLTAGSARFLGLNPGTRLDAERQKALFALLPKLISEAGEKRQWQIDELFDELGWHDPFALRHEHVFPVDSLCQSNPRTEANVRAALKAVEGGYISLLGAPGSGKSTLLQTGLIGTPDTIFLRYLAFVPDEGHGLGRAEATDFLQDIIAQLKRQGLGRKLVAGEQLPELRLQFETLLREAGTRFANSSIRTVVIVDGLDHIPREERPEHSLLQVLPLPHALPRGVIFLLGSQKLDLLGIPPSVRDQAGANGRRIEIAPLSRDAVYRIADASNLLDDIDRDALFERSEGHPLSIRYLIEGLLAIPTTDERQAWLHEGPAFGGSTEAFYDRAWHEVENDTNAKLALSYIALVEGYVDPVQLDDLVGRAATDHTGRAALHLFKRDRAGRWSIFHNSFRQFLLEKLSFRFGRRNEAERRQCYSDLAGIAARAATNDPQRWLELRYLARAEDHDGVLALATPARFRSQFVDQRSPSDIQADIRFAFTSSRARKDVTKVFELMLCRHEIEMRAGAISAESLIDAYIAMGDLDAATGVIEASYAGVPEDAPFKVVDALLSANRPEEARQVFEQAEPIDKLLGTEAISLDREDDVLFDWASRALIFRDHTQFNAALDQLRLSDHSLRHEISGALDEFRRELRVTAARAVLNASPDTDLSQLCVDLYLSTDEIPNLSIASAEIAQVWHNRELVSRRLRSAVASVEVVDSYQRRRGANLAFALGDLDLGRRFFQGLKPPNLILKQGMAGERIIGATYAVFGFAAAEQRACEGELARDYPDGLHGAYQRKLEAVGRLFGRGRAGLNESPESAWQCIRDLMTVAAHGGSGSRTWDSERWEMNYALPAIAELALLTAKAHGPDALALAITNIDALVKVNPGRLGLPAFRRAFAVAAYESEHNTQKALRRLPNRPSIEEHNTPDEFATEMCELASAQAKVGDLEGAHQTLTATYKDALGISRPARKDGQYEMWQAIFANANKDDPNGREKRVRFFARLLVGLAQTEGQGSAQRIVGTVMRDAAACSPQLANACFRAFDEADIGTWAVLLTATLRGMITRRPDLAPAIAIVFNHLVLPVMDRFDRDFYPALLSATTTPQSTLDAVVARVVVDADQNFRYSILQQLSELAATHKLEFPQDALDRWRPPAEQQKTDSSSTVRDPFEGIETLAALAQALQRPEASDDDWHAGQALERLAAMATYDEVKGFADYSQIKRSHNGMLAIARAAARSNAREDVERHVTSLRLLADKDGSWGSWQSGAKLRLHRLLIDIEGDTARQRAFDAFVYDLSRGREWSGSLVPDLADVFSLFAEKADWPGLFDILSDHLKEFRDFQIGNELILCSDAPATEEALIADIMISAVELMTSDLCAQVRFASRDLENCGAIGNDIIATLIRKLWSRGGEFALEGTRIAWETRRAPGVEALLRSNIVSLVESDDLAVMRFGMALVGELDVAYRSSPRPLPSFYKLEIPEADGADIFEPPSGFSSTERGLWTDDPYAWTWPLEPALKSLSKAANVPVHKIRLRVAERMRENGGRDLFGPEAVEAQHSRLLRLDLRLRFRRLPIIAAFRAAREVGAELLRADRFRMRELPIFLDRTGGPNLNFSSLPPVACPGSLVPPHISGTVWSSEVEKWVCESAAQPSWPSSPCGVVVASAGMFNLVSIRRELAEEHLFIHGTELAGSSELHEVLSTLPRLVALGPLIPLYDEPSESGIAVIAPDRAGTFADCAMTLCPIIATRVGLRVDPDNPLNYLNRAGDTVIRALWWRDGGLHRRDTDRSIRGEGYAVVASTSIWPVIQPFLSKMASIRRWRHATNEDSVERTLTKELRWELVNKFN